MTFGSFGTDYTEDTDFLPPAYARQWLAMDIITPGNLPWIIMSALCESKVSV